MPFYKRIFLIAQILIWVAVLWPGHYIFGASKPLILGFPLSFFWIILCVLISFMSMYLYYRKEFSEADSGSSVSKEEV